MSIKKVSDSLTPSLDKKISELSKIPEQAYGVFYESTPIRTGNARSNTKLRGQRIAAEYSYAGALDKGRSQQSPNGMTEPTKAFIKKILDRQMRRK